MSAPANTKTYFPRRAWVGIDTTQTPPRVVAAWRVPGGLRRVEVAPAVLRERRPDGTRCVAGLPMSRVFCEYVAPPARACRQARRLAPGMLDLRLPLPVERCAIAWIPSPSPDAPAALLAFAVPHEALGQALQPGPARTVDTERIVPVAHALWRRWARLEPPDGAALRLLLHAGSDAWTLLIGRGAVLQSSLTLPGGDLAALARNLEVFRQRWSDRGGHLLLCGPGADESLLRQARNTPLLTGATIELAPEPAAYLATALAETAADGGATGDLREGFRDHPAWLRRQARAALRQTAILLAASALLWAVHLAALHRATCDMAAADAALTRQAIRLAGRTLPARGAAAVELARNELDTRLNPVVEAFADDPLVGKVDALLRVAALRSTRIATLTVDDRRIELAGSAVSEADIAVLREAGRREHLAAALESESTTDGRVHFEGTFMHEGVRP